MKYVKVVSSTWAGTDKEELIPLEDFGFDEDATEEEIYEDKDAVWDLRNVAEQQQHFEWGFSIVEKE